MKVLICFGTRPEYIKVKSLIENIPHAKICMTGQHTDLLAGIRSDYLLNIENFAPNRLNNLFVNILKNSYIFDDVEYVLVQGDTTSAVAMAVSAVHHGKKVIHLEAGLRTYDIDDPFPEELNRQIISRIAYVHLCPTELNKQNLALENITKNVYVVGNTGLDSIRPGGCTYGQTVFITLHRRKNVETIHTWFSQLDSIACDHPEYDFVIALHPNPEIQKCRYLLKHVRVIEPQSHVDTIEIIRHCNFIISDSGGIQEESSFLKKKIIICRSSTERPEILGTTGLLCPSPNQLRRCFEVVSQNPYTSDECPFGEGKSYVRVKQVLDELTGLQPH
jgi:UDP-N-acetylglucosamine 2-epimerase (non-hydrolysing)